MIILTRVDHRLLHGQVAFSWTQSLGADCILIANDDVPTNDIRKTTIKLAKPQGVKLVIKTIEDSIHALKSGVTDKYKLFIVVESIEDAYKLAENYPEITKINLGGIKAKEGTKNIGKAVNVLPFEEELLKKWLLKESLSISGKYLQIKSRCRRCFIKKGVTEMLQAILLGIVAFIAQSEYALGTSLLSRPIVTGLFTGIVLGDVSTGIIMGATLELAFIGSFLLVRLFRPMS